MTTVRITISLPLAIARETEKLARDEGKTFSAVVEESLRSARKERLTTKLRSLQDYWSRRARERNLLTPDDLARYLGE